MKREAEATWAAERVENALLRERINDVAAEVAKLAVVLEGPNSPIEAILVSDGATAPVARNAADGAVPSPVNENASDDQRFARTMLPSDVPRAGSPIVCAHCRPAPRGFRRPLDLTEYPSEHRRPKNVTRHVASGHRLRSIG